MGLKIGMIIWKMGKEAKKGKKMFAEKSLIFHKFQMKSIVPLI